MSRLEELNPMTRTLMTKLINALAAAPSVQSELTPAIVVLHKQVTDLTALKIYEAEEAANHDPDDDDDDDEWMTIYNVGDFNDFCGNHEHLEMYRGFRYYQCWGGGPEGGFITDTMAVYRVNRTWGGPFTVESIRGRLELNADSSQLRIVNS